MAMLKNPEEDTATAISEWMQRQESPTSGSFDAAEQVRALERRVVELEHLNEAYRRGAERITAAESINSVLDSFLLEAMHLTNSVCGAIADRVTGTEFVLRSLAENGSILHPDLHSKEWRFRERTAADPAGMIAKLVSGESFCLSVDQLAAWYPEAADFHRARNHHSIWHFPFSRNGEVIGFLALAFSEDASFCQWKTATVLSFAQQASLALKVVHLAEEAKRGAIACERAAQVQSVATELANSNTLMRTTLDELANTRDPEVFVKVTLREVCRQAQANAAHLFSYDSATDRLTQFGAVRNDEFCDQMHPDDVASFGEGIGTDTRPGFRRLLEQGGIHWVDAETVLDDPWPETLAAPLEAGHTAYASQVLTAGCKPIGLLRLTFHDRKHLSANARDLIQVLAQHMAFALGLKRLTENAREAAVLAERERAANQRASELAKTNAVLRDATDRLANQAELGSFYGHLVEEAGSLLGADLVYLNVVDEASDSLRKIAYLKNGVLSVPNYSITMPLAQVASILERFCSSRSVRYLDLEQDRDFFQPGAIDYHRSAGHSTIAAIPLVLSGRCIGYIGLAFVNRRQLTSEEEELLQALAQHATLAIHLTQLAEQVRRGAILEERVALARELHDTLLQGFTGITLQLRALLKHTTHDVNQFISVIESIEADATRSVREARRAVGDMRGNEPGNADLVTALQELVQSERSRTSSHLCWKLEGEALELPGQVAESLFRIGREALSNAIRHADAECIEVALSVSPKLLRLLVRDNGRGFAATSEIARQQGHWGLVGMEERAERLAGRCHIESEPGRGTTVSVEVPL